VLWALALACSLPACRRDFEAEARHSPPGVVPAPRHFTQAGGQPLGPAALVVSDTPSDLVLSAAEEINLRLRELGEPPLRVVSGGSPDDAAFAGRRIALAIAPHAAGGRPQGYTLDSTDPAFVRLAGRDAQGLLWAAVTLRRLLQADTEGRVTLASATVSDWPDFPLRMVNPLTRYPRERSEAGLLDALRRRPDEPGRYADAYAHETKAVLDFLVRLKLNLAWLPLGGVPHTLDALEAAAGRRERADAFLATLRRVTDYARARGVTVCEAVPCDAGVSPGDDADPEASRCALHHSTKRYYCWSLDGRTRRRAEQAARLFGQAGYGLVLLQLPDARYADANLWERRCQACRARWGEDRAAADAHLLNLWHRAFRQHAPAVSLLAVPSPADPGILLQPDHPDHDRRRAYWASLHARLDAPESFALAVRESAQPAIQAFSRLVRPRPLFVLWNIDATAGDDAWCPLFSSRARHAVTFARAGSVAGVLATATSCSPLAAAAGAQYLWNADSPGAEPWPGDLDVERDGSEPAPFFGAALPSLLAAAYGDKAGPPLAEVFLGCVSPSYCALPGEVARLAETANSVSRMRQQYAALVRASASLERVWQRFETGERHLIYTDAAPAFYGLTEQVARARVWASYHSVHLGVAEALRAGRPRPAIAAELSDAIPRVAADAAAGRRLAARVAARPRAGAAEPSPWVARSLRALDSSEAEAALVGRLERLLKVVRGTTLELRESPEAATRSLPLVPKDGEGVTLRGKGAARLRLVRYPARGGSAIQIEGLTQPWHDGAAVGFPAVDVARHLGARSALRFYINGGAAGGQQLTFWLYARGAGGDPAPPDTKWPYVALGDYVAVDDLEATWQLVSIPLDRLLPAGYTQVTGFGLNNATYGEVCGPVWIDTLYVAPDAKPVEVEVPVQEPPAQAPATEARVLAVGVQPTTAMAADGPVSRLMLALNVVGNGYLSNVRITLRVLDRDGEELLAREAVAAEQMRTPWWSPSIRCHLTRLVPKCRLEMTLASDEVRGTGAVDVTW